MDRRQRKTREAVFEAFITLLSQKSASQITVSEIIDLADVGRATFYSHFETKDFLLKELCGELFCHIFDTTKNGDCSHRHIFSCEAPSSVYLHLLQHLMKNDNHILKLLSCPDNELFLGYFKSELQTLTESQLECFNPGKLSSLPKDFVVNHISSVFVETVRWWIKNGMKESPEEIHSYFLLAING